MPKDSPEKAAAKTSANNPTLAVYAADLWQHVCPVVRLISPAEQAGFDLIQGTEWTDQVLQVYPERMAEADLVVITRDFPRWSTEYEQVMEEARARGKFVVYELDDLLLEIPEQHPDHDRYSTTRSAILKAVVEADGVVGSSPAICDYLRAFNPNTHLWENYLDDRLWQVKKKEPPQNSPVTIGYMGGHSHSYDLQPLIPTLNKILLRFPEDLKMVFWGIQPADSLRNLPNVEWIPVAIAGYRDFAAYFRDQRCDIFIAPLQDNLFNHCKSHLKFLEYGVLGTPGVYSKITPYERVVIHSENGFLAATPDDWEACLTELIEDPGLRLRLGGRAKATVAEHWMLSDHVNEWVKLYQGFARQPIQTGKSQIALATVRKMVFFQQTLESELTQNYEAKSRQKSLQSQIAEKDQVILEIDKIAQKYYNLYHEVIYSQSWRMMERLIRLRLRLAPLGSLRDRILRAVYRPAVSLKNLGVRGFLIQTRLEIRSLTRNQPALEKTDGSKLNYELFPGPIPAGATCPFPAIGVLIFQHDGAGEVQPQQVLRWTETQTLAESVNTVVWDRASGSAAALDGSDLHWDAPNIQALAEKIESRYVCIASEDLLYQEPTYLETNLLALESESLAFTVNLQGKDWQTSPHLASDKPPSHNLLPLHRLVVRKDCIADDLSIDLHAWRASRADLPESSRNIREQRPPAAAGKVLVHTTNRADDEMTPPCEVPCAQDLTLFDRHFLAIGAGTPSQDNLSQMLIPIHKVILARREPSDLPTVFMVMPFLAVGGAEKIALKVMKELADRIRFVVLAFDDLDPELGTTADQFRRITPYVYMIPDFLNAKLNGSFMEYLIARFDPRTIYIANGTPWIYDALSSLKHRHPSIRIVDQVYDSEVGWINRYDAALITYLDGHIGSNPKICQAYIEKGALPEQVYYIENGTDPAELNPGEYGDVRVKNLKVKLGLPLNTQVVTFASRLNPQKRPLDFIELARRFSSNSGVTFMMVGDGPLAQTVDEQVHKIGLKNIYRHPFYQPISDILAISDVLVLPSEFEGMPMIIIEMLTMGKPVVATDVGNVREIIARTNGGIVVSQIGDISALTAGVQKMLETAPPPHEIRQAALDHFDWKVCAEKHLPAFFGSKNA